MITGTIYSITVALLSPLIISRVLTCIYRIICPINSHVHADIDFHVNVTNLTKLALSHHELIVATCQVTAIDNREHSCSMSDTGDAIVNAFANDYADKLASGVRQEDLDENDLFDELDNFDDSSYRSARLQQLSSELKSIKSLSPAYGRYTEIKDEKEVLSVTTGTDRVVAHFFHNDFQRCKIMDKHLETLAQRHIHTRFVKIDVESCPFLVTRLQIQVLPCVIPFINGIGKERILGFEGLGGDNFSTGMLELTLRKSGVIKSLRGDHGLQGTKKSIVGFAEKDEEYESND